MPITIRCPKCSTKLKIDDAFSAGVCRCGKCGQVMKVPKRKPKDASIAPAEKSARPDAPPGSTPDESVKASTPSPPAPPPPPQESFDDDDPLAALAAQAADADGHEPPSEVPPAPAEDAPPPAEETPAPVEASSPPAAPKKKRKGNRMMMLFIIFGSCIIIGGFVALAMFAMGGDRSAVRKEVREELGFDPSVNPFTVDMGNALGVPLAKRSVIAIDASGTSRQWFTLVQDAVMAGVKKLGPKSELQVIFWVEGEPSAYPRSGPITMTEQTIGKLQTFFDDISPSGQADASPAMVEAVKTSPDQIVLITSQQLFPDALKDLGEVLGGYPNVKVDAIAIDEDLPDLQAMIEGRGGRFVPMPQSRIEDWYREAQSAPPEAASQ